MLQFDEFPGLIPINPSISTLEKRTNDRSAIFSRSKRRSHPVEADFVIFLENLFVTMRDANNR